MSMYKFDQNSMIMCNTYYNIKILLYDIYIYIILLFLYFDLIEMNINSY